MIIRTCNGTDSSFNRPLPWIGLFSAMSSFIISISMFVDAFHGFRHRRFSFPCKVFSITPTSLTLLSLALFLLHDLNTYMPRSQDQLVKLSSTVLTCVSMGNLMPSLGALHESQVTPNAIALGMIAIAALLYACIQMGTGIVYAFLFEHALIIFFISILFLILCSSTIIVPTTKRLLQSEYDRKIQHFSHFHEAEDLFLVGNLKNFVKRRWTMAHACNPQSFLACSATCSASGALSVMGALVFIQALLRSQFSKSLSLCDGMSDYKWSITLVLVSHTMAILVGAIAPAFRFFHAIGLLGLLTLGRWSELHVESYWVQRLEEWKDRALHLPICSPRSRKLVIAMTNEILNFCLVMQIMLVLSSKFICWVSVLAVSRLKCSTYFGCRGTLDVNSGFNQRKSVVKSSCLNPDLSNFVLHHEEGSEAIHSILKCCCMDAEEWIVSGAKKKPAYMMALLRKSTSISQGFQGAGLFHGGHIPLLLGDEPLNCWALPVVTLTSIAVAIVYSTGHHNLINPLILGVDEGLKFVGIIEKRLNARRLTYEMEAADIVWQQIELHKRWLDIDLHQLALKEKNPLKILGKLADAAKRHVDQNMMADADREQNMAIPSRKQRWSAKELAANSMHTTCLTILQHFNDREIDEMDKWLQNTIAEILGACLTNLPRVISMQCGGVAIESMEDNIRQAAYLLGEAEETLGFLVQLQSVADA